MSFEDESRSERRWIVCQLASAPFISVGQRFAQRLIISWQRFDDAFVIGDWSHNSPK